MMKHLVLAASITAPLCAPGMSSARAQPSLDEPDPAAQAEATPPAPPPAVQPAPAPRIPPPLQARAAPATGQWVYTQQYGWLWMPYGNQYVQVPDANQPTGYPQEYVYAPLYGWTWLNAPWIWGWGPDLYFGVGGFGHFAWYRPHAVIVHGAELGVRGHIGVDHIGGGHVGGGHVGGGHFGGGHFGGRR